MNPLREVHNFRELLQNWRMDALALLRYEVPKILFIVVVTVVLIRLLRAVTEKLVSFTRKQELPSGVRVQQLRTLASVVNSVGTFVIVFLALMQVLPLLGINMGPLLASAGIAGLAIGFGAQTLVKDVLNGFFVLLENQFDIGDVVRVAGVTGTVEAMTLRRTVLRDMDGSLHTIPNSEVRIVTNLTRDWAQMAMHVAVDYSENSDRIIGLLKEIGRDLRNDPEMGDRLVADPEVPGIERVAGNEVDYLMLIKTKPGQQWAVSRELRRRIKDCFDKHGIKAAGPRHFVLDQPPVGQSKT